MKAISSLIKIDLHGIKHEDVRRILINKIEEYWNQEVDYVIVTGNSVEMREIATSVLKEYSLSYELGLHSSYLRVYF